MTVVQTKVRLQQIGSNTNNNGMIAVDSAGLVVAKDWIQLLDSGHVIRIGSDVAGQETNAGKIGYQSFSSYLDIIGAGATPGARYVKVWDNLEVSENINIGAGHAYQVNGVTVVDGTKTGVTNGDSHDHNGGDGAQISYLNLSNAPVAEVNTNDIFNVGNTTTSAFSGTINGAPSGTSVVYNAGFTGSDLNLVATATTQLAKLVLYNTTRGTSALISTAVTATKTITLTATVPAGWANGDTITIASQTVSGGTGNWVDLKITSGPTGKSYMFFNCQWRDSGAPLTTTILRLHPTETFSSQKNFAIPAQATNLTMTATPLMKITSDVFSASWITTGVGTGNVVIREMGYLS